jgi:transposase
MSLATTQKLPEIPFDPTEKDDLILRQHAEIQYLTHQNELFRRKIFGQKTERVVPDVPEEQMSLEGLFELAETKIPGFAEAKETITYERRKPKKGHGRKPFPDDLLRVDHVIDVPAEEKKCSCCGTEKVKIGEETSEELEHKPAVFFVNRTIRPKYVCPKKCPDGGVTTAPMPPRPIDKGIAGPGLLAYILISKFVDHLPLYRLEQMFKRYQIHINRSTMAGWLTMIGGYLDAVYQEMKKQIISASFLIQADETTLKIQNDMVKDKCDLGYLWPYIGDGKTVVFEFKDSRSREGPTDFLAGFKDRYLLSDGYAGYNQVVEKNSLTHLMCWAHARRKFFDVKDLDPDFSKQVIALVAELYAVEREAAELDKQTGAADPARRHALRQEKSVPALEKIKALLENPGKVILPKSPVGGAVAYTLNHWKQLTRFLEDGRLPIDNNLAENTIRPVALGRKNWLFAGSLEAAQRMAIFYSLIATCKINGINPYEYFYDILPKVASYDSRKIADLTPLNWKIAQDKKSG